MGRFHRYSANNILLIHLQRHDAARVAGFSAWRNFGQFVRRSAYGASMKGRILLRDDLSPAAEFSVLVHEVAHELLHGGDRRSTTSKTVRETEAEAVAFRFAHYRSRDEHGGQRLHPAVPR